MNSTYLKGAGDAIRDLQMLPKIISGDAKAHYANRWLKDYAKAFIPSGVKQISKVFINDDFRKISTEWNTLIESVLFNKNLVRFIFLKTINFEERS